MIRLPSHAGSFYKRSSNFLREEIEQCFLDKSGPGKIPKLGKGPRRIVSLVCPHAGLMYSGSVAANAYYYAACDGKPSTVVIIGPNHTGYGSGISIMLEGVWRTPFGDIEIDRALAKEIYKNSKFIDIDEIGHRFEHSIEVQLPFLQYIYGTAFKLVPICMMMQDLDTSIDLGESIADSILRNDVLIIASSDLSHYVSQKTAEAKDHFVISAILNLNSIELQSVVESENISMCGYGPVSATIVASKKLNALESKLLAYKTSGDITGDYSQVVGYASFVISK